MTSGQIEWYDDGLKGEFIGRLVQYNPKRGTASSFSCPAPCRCRPEYLDGFVTPGSIEGLAGESFTLTAMERVRDCHGNEWPRAARGLIFWTPSDPALVSVEGNVLTLLDGGEARVDADWNATHVYRTCTDPGEGCIERCEYFDTLGFGQANVRSIKVEITQGGTVITNTTRDVIVGQELNLAASVTPDGLTVSNPQWTIPGTRIGRVKSFV